LPLVEKGDYSDDPKIPENYYQAELANIRSYDRDNREAAGLVMNFAVEHDGDEEEIPFFAPAKLSISEDRQSSRLGENLVRIGLLEPVLEILDVDPGLVKAGSHKWHAETEDEAEELEHALQAVFEGKTVRVNVEDDRSGDASQVSKLSEISENGDGVGE
jgi:hypothetical protein